MRLVILSYGVMLVCLGVYGKLVTPEPHLTSPAPVVHNTATVIDCQKRTPYEPVEDCSR